MTTLGELLKDGYTTIAESEAFVHLQNRHGQNLLYSRKTGTYIPFTIHSRSQIAQDGGARSNEGFGDSSLFVDDTLQSIRDYDGWCLNE